MSIVTITNHFIISPHFMQERIERRLQAYAEMNDLDMIDALDKALDVALMWHRTVSIVKCNLLKESSNDINKFYRG